MTFYNFIAEAICFDRIIGSGTINVANNTIYKNYKNYDSSLLATTIIVNSSYS